jgi:hypothetical protein
MRLVVQVGALTAVSAAVLLLIIYKSGGWLPPVIGFGALFGLFLTMIFASTGAECLSSTCVTITPEQVHVWKKRLGKKPTECVYPLNDRSHAYKWYQSRHAGHDHPPRAQGIEIHDAPYNAEQGSAPFDESKARFGWTLSEEEMDEIVLRINDFIARSRRC